jgi:hypothetical protein
MASAPIQPYQSKRMKLPVGWSGCLFAAGLSMKYMSFSCERAFESLTGIIEQIFIKYRLKLLNKSGYHADVS